jgi:hypothetical protein
VLVPEALPPPPGTEETHTYVEAWEDELGAGVSLLVPEAPLPTAEDDPSSGATTDAGAPPDDTASHLHYVFEPELNATVPIYFPDAIAPPQLWKRAPPAGPLFGSSGGPTMNDIRQSESERRGRSLPCKAPAPAPALTPTATIPNCGFLSAVGAVLHTNSRWLSNIISSDGAPATARTATFNVHSSGGTNAQRVKVDKTGLPSNRGDRSEVW